MATVNKREAQMVARRLKRARARVEVVSFALLDQQQLFLEDEIKTGAEKRNLWIILRTFFGKFRIFRR